MDPELEVNRLLDEHGAVLTRKRKHQVWTFPDGKTFVRASTPSDKRAAANNLSDLRHVLGLVGGEATEGERRRKATTGPARTTQIHAAPRNETLADKLRLTGTVETQLRATIVRLESENADLRARRCQSWWCRLKRWIETWTVETYN